MNKLALVLPFLAILIFAPFVVAQEVRNSEVVTLASDQTVDKDYFATGEKVVISGIVNGDVYVFGGNVIVDGTVNGDLIAGGGTVSVTGRVTDDARIGGGQVDVSGEIGRNLTAGGGSINISQNAKIGGSLVAGGGNVNVLSALGRGATVGGGNLTLANSVGGDVTAGVGSLTLLQNANVAGDLNYWSSQPADIQSGAQINGQTNFHMTEEKDGKSDAAAGINFGFSIYSFLVALIFGFIFIRFLPNFTQATADRITKKPLASLGIGFLALVTVPIFAIILAITILGIPFALLLMLFYIVDLYLAKIFVAIAVGAFLANYFKKKWGLMLSFVVGLAVYCLLSLIPVLGWLAVCIITLIGFGALIVSKKTNYESIRAKKLI